MTIDKFGRSLKPRGESLKGQKGEGFNLTSDGDYDMQSKRICNLTQPIDDQDAVNLTFVKNNTLTKSEQGVYDGKNCIIRNLASPLNVNDAVNKGYVDYKIIPFTAEYYNMQNKILRNTGDAKEDADAVNLRVFKAEISQFLKLENEQFDCKNKQLKNAADPTDFQDAVNLNYIVRLTSQILFDIYNSIKSIQIGKDEWVKTHVIDKYFLNSETRHFRNNDEIDPVNPSDILGMMPPAT